MKKGIILLAFISVVMLLPSSSSAGAWVNKVGESTFINSFYYFHFNEMADSKQVVTDTHDFMKYEYKPYYEYGFVDKYSWGLSPSFQHVQEEFANVSESGADKNEALAEIDVFIKREIFKSDKHGYVISISPVVELPGIYEDKSTPSLGKQESFWSLIAAVGANTYSIENNYGYINFETGIRDRFTNAFEANGGASYKASFVASLPVTSDHSVNFGVDYTKSVSVYPQGFSNYLNRYGYDSLQFSATDVYKFKNFDIEFGYIQQSYAKNAGIGQGIKFSILHKF